MEMRNHQNLIKKYEEMKQENEMQKSIRDLNKLKNQEEDRLWIKELIDKERTAQEIESLKKVFD